MSWQFFLSHRLEQEQAANKRLQEKTRSAERRLNEKENLLAIVSSERLDLQTRVTDLESQLDELEQKLSKVILSVPWNQFGGSPHACTKPCWPGFNFLCHWPLLLASHRLTFQSVPTPHPTPSSLKLSTPKDLPFWMLGVLIINMVFVKFPMLHN